MLPNADDNVSMFLIALSICDIDGCQLQQACWCKAMAFLSILTLFSNFGVSEKQIKDIFAKHLGEDNSCPNVGILEQVDPDGKKSNYFSDIKRIAVLVPQGFTDGLATCKIANFLIKTQMGTFIEKV